MLLTNHSNCHGRCEDSSKRTRLSIDLNKVGLKIGANPLLKMYCTPSIKSHVTFFSHTGFDPEVVGLIFCSANGAVEGKTAGWAR